MSQVCHQLFGWSPGVVIFSQQLWSASLWEEAAEACLDGFDRLFGKEHQTAQPTTKSSNKKLEIYIASYSRETEEHAMQHNISARFQMK